MIIEFLDQLFEHTTIINCDHDPYLERWYIVRSKKFSMYVHKFVRSDEDRALHDHPWNFLVIPIWRGYNEYNLKGIRRVYPIFGTRYRKAEYRHRVKLINNKEAWSIFVTFNKRRMWGFWPIYGFVDYKKWWRDLCE